MSPSQELLSHHTCSLLFLSDDSKLYQSIQPCHLWTLVVVLYETLHFTKSSCVGGIYLAFVISDLFFLCCHLMPFASHSIRERIHCSCLSYRTYSGIKCVRLYLGNTCFPSGLVDESVIGIILTSNLTGSMNNVCLV